jgi:hypothetical protein
MFTGPSPRLCHEQGLAEQLSQAEQITRLTATDGKR